MSKIYHLSNIYRILRNLVIKTLYLYYDEIIVVGKENIPTNGGFIFAPNHRNALMDALAILLITPKDKSTSFLARSDIFKNKYVAKFLHFTKIMPAFRIRDGFENLGKNNDVFDQCVELLEAEHALCIMPEGNQELPHKVRPLVKGIFRVAFSMQQRNKSEHPLQIVPVGFDYGHLVKYGKHLIINIGEPIDVSAYDHAYKENPPKAINEIKNELKKRLEKLTLHIDSELNYDTILAAIDYSTINILQKNKIKPTTKAIYEIRKQLSDKLCRIEKEEPKLLKELSESTSEYKKILDKNHIQYRNIDQIKSVKYLISNILLLIIAFPFALTGFILNVFPFFTPVWLRKMLKVKFEGFFSSIQYVLGLILFPIFYLIQTSLICKFTAISLLYLPLLFVIQMIIGILSYKYYSTLKCTTASIRVKLLSDDELKKIKSLGEKLSNKLAIVLI